MARGPAPDPGILVDRQIREAVEGGWLGIEPFDEGALEPATYDLKVGDVAVVSTHNRPVDLREDSYLAIEPYATALLRTDEVLTLSRKIAGRLGPRSNLLRQGIFVATGPQIDPGFHGRLFVNLLNVTDRPFVIQHRSKFLSVEFHALSVEPSKAYVGPHQNRLEFSDDQINAILGRGGTSIKDVYQTLLQMQVPIRNVAALSSELPPMIERQEKVLRSTLERPPSIVVPITTLGPGSLELRRDLPIVVQPVEDGFVATFFDANLSISGDTQQEAIEGLKSLLVEVLEDLESEPHDRLGPEPSRQLDVLRAVIRRSG